MSPWRPLNIANDENPTHVINQVGRETNGRIDSLSKSVDAMPDFANGYTAYKPTVTPNGAGAFTTVKALGRFKVHGTTVHVHINITYTNIAGGGGATSIVSLPVVANKALYQALHGVEVGVNGKGITGQIGFLGGHSTLVLRYTDASPVPTANNEIAVISGTYETNQT